MTADIERIAPPVPTLPAPIGRGIPSRRRSPPRDERAPHSEHNADSPPPSPTVPNDHIDEYV
jgi:hypothetical protein